MCDRNPSIGSTNGLDWHGNLQGNALAMSPETLNSSLLVLTVTTTIVLGGVLLYALSKRCSSTCPQDDLPPDGLRPLSALPGPPQHPRTGNLRELTRRNVHRLLTQWADEYGGLYTLDLMGSPILVVSDIQLVRPLVKGPGELRRNAAAVGGARQLTNGSKVNNMFTVSEAADLPWHAAIRKALAPAFAPSNLIKRYPRSRHHAARLATKLASLGGSDEEEVDISLFVLAGSMDMVTDTGFGMSFDTMDDPVNNKFFKGLNGAVEELSKRMVDFDREQRQARFWFLPSSQKVLRDHEEAYKVYRQIMHELESRGPPADDDQSIGACIMRFRDPATGKPLQGEHLQAEVATMLVAAIGTSASATLWALYDIARQADVQRGLEKELTDAGLITTEGRPGRLPEWWDLTSLPYFNAVLKESMRLHDVAGSTATYRVTDQPLQIGNCWVPAGTPVWIPIHALANARHNFPVPSEFHPERWAESRNTVGLVADTPAPAATTTTTTKAVEEGSLTSPHDWTALVFGQGTRGCPGVNQGLMQVRTTLLVLLSRLRFKVGPTAADHQAMEEAQEMHLNMISGLGYPFIITPR